MSNILKAIKNLAITPIPTLVAYYSGRNRANSVGDALECYIRDLFADSINKGAEQALQAHRQVFAYLGNQNNPPDMILRNGDAIEVKKIESLNSSLALNSSYPKDYLYSNSPMLTTACKNSDGGEWNKKDIIYVVGTAKNNLLKGLWFVYGDCYAADSEVYERIKSNIDEGIRQSPNVELAETNELARINKVDPLGITYLRVRGMWGIDNPIKVFKYLELVTNTNFFAHIIMKKSKFDSFPDEDKNTLIELSEADERFTIEDIEISCPNNPASTIDAKLMSFII